MPPGESLDEHLDVLHRESGAIVTRKLPTLKLYKIGVKLDMTGKTAAERQGRGARARAARSASADMHAPELSDLEVAAIRVVQEDLPIVERPFAGARRADRLLDEDDGPRAAALVSRNAS